MIVSNPKDYLTTTNELTSIANTIRTKFSLSGNLEYPNDYIDNINNVQMYDVIGYVQKTISTFSASAVSKVGSYAFISCTNLTDVSLPNCSVISPYGFSGCSQLTNVYLPNCSTVSQYAFANCSSLTSLVLDFNNISTIGSWAFQYCQIPSIHLPNCTFVDQGAFYSCSLLSQIDIPQCSSIEANAFAYCLQLSTVNCPSCVSIGQYAFNNCRNLDVVAFPICTFIGSYAFQSCSSLCALNDTFSIEFLGSFAFQGCINLDTIDLPNISSLYMSTFYSCYNLTYIYLDNYNSSTHIVPLANASVFSYTPMAGYSASTSSYGKIYVNDMDYSTYISSTNWTYFSDHIFPSGANLYSTSAVYLSSSLSIPSYMESFSTSSFSFTNSIGSVFNSFRISSYSQVYYDNYLVYDGYWNDDTGQEITFQTDSSNAYPPEFVKWFYSNQSTSGGGDDEKISDLTNTGWFFSSSINYPAGVEYEQYYNISFTARDNSSWIGIKILPNSYIQYVSSYGVSTTVYSGSWTNSDFRYINIISSADVTNTMLIEFITTNASQTHSWVFNDSTLYLTEATSSGTTTWNIEFYPTGNYTSENKFIALRLNPGGFGMTYFDMYYISSALDRQVYQSGNWTSGTIFKSITITTGTDKDNPDLLEFLQLNATQIN